MCLCASQLDICDGNVETASEWILENNWRELIEEEDGDEGGEEAGGDVDDEDARVLEQQQTRLPLRASAAVAAPAMVVSAQSNHGLTISGGSAQPGPDNAQSPRSTNTNPVEHHQGTHYQQRHHHHQHNQQFASSSSAAVGSTNANTTATASSNGRALDRDFDSGGEHDLESDEGEFEEDEDEDDDDDDDDDDDEDGHSYYDSGDEAYFHSGSGGGSALLPLTKRIKITREDDGESTAAADGDGTVAKMKDSNQEMYWVAFDGQVVRKTLIELLNTTLSKLAHSKVTLLNKSTKHIDEV